MAWIELSRGHLYKPNFKKTSKKSHILKIDFNWMDVSEEPKEVGLAFSEFSDSAKNNFS